MTGDGNEFRPREVKEQDAIRIHAGSTRIVTLRSRGDRVAFARSALEGMVEQARTGFIAISLEHLNFLPPIGRWYDGELIDADDGETDVFRPPP